MSLVNGEESGSPPTDDTMALRETLHRLLRYAEGEEEYVAPFTIMVEVDITVNGKLQWLAASKEEAERTFMEAVEKGRVVPINMGPLPIDLARASHVNRIIGIQ